jgi:putative endonuclease
VGTTDSEMYYTYILFSFKSGILYCGSSSDLRQRVKDHNAGIGGDYTSKHRPFKLVFYEAFLSEEDALKQEKFYKSGYGREVLKEKIKNSLKKV